jgi:hypothetical protein
MSQYLINYNHAGARFTVKPFQSAFEICEAAIDDVVLDRKILNDIVDRALTEFQASNHGSPQTPNRKKISPIVDSPDCVFDFHEEKMHDFYYKNGELYCDKARVAKILKKTGTPAYIYSHKTFVEHLVKLQKAFRSAKHAM